MSGRRQHPDLEPPMTTTEVAQLFGVGGKTVTRWARTQRLPFFRTPGGQRRFPRAEVLWLAAQRQTERTDPPQEAAPAEGAN